MVLFFCDRTRSDQDENWDENGDDDWDDAGMMHSGLVGFLWQQLIKREGVYGPPGIIQMALLGSSGDQDDSLAIIRPSYQDRSQNGCQERADQDETRMTTDNVNLSITTKKI